MDAYFLGLIYCRQNHFNLSCGEVSPASKQEKNTNTRSSFSLQFPVRIPVPQSNSSTVREFPIIHTLDHHAKSGSSCPLVTGTFYHVYLFQLLVMVISDLFLSASLFLLLSMTVNVPQCVQNVLSVMLFFLFFFSFHLCIQFAA